MMEQIRRINRFKMEELSVDETILSMSNGYLGVRGNFPEGYGLDTAKQTYLNGFYNTYPYQYEENSIHFPQQGNRIVNVLDAQTIEFQADGQWLNLMTCNLLELKRTYDMETGITSREALYQSKTTKRQFLLSEKRMVSFYQKELFLSQITLTPLSGESHILVRSKVELPKQRLEKKMDPRINIAKNPEIIITKKIIKSDVAGLVAKTSHTDLKLSVLMAHDTLFEYEESAQGVEGVMEGEYSEKLPCSFTKFVVFNHSLIHPDLSRTPMNLIRRVIIQGADFYLEKQESLLHQFWDDSYVNIEGQEDLGSIIRYNIYQLHSSHMGIPQFNIASKGLSGEGYEGHYFWDTEIYMFPFFLWTNPERAKALIVNRYRTLAQSRVEANHLGVQTGAKIPWRTITGTELSPYYPAGSAQIHINSDVAYTVIEYFRHTSDKTFLRDIGFELLVETGRFLLEYGVFNESGFHLNTVTGPDEYTAIVNDNFYTNAMAKYHFEVIVKWYSQYHDLLASTVKQLELSEEEIHRFDRASKEMAFIYDDSLGIYAQDEGFLRKKRLDIASIPEENFPLLLHYHPLFIYRHQVLKQADTLLALLLLQEKDYSLLRRTFDYYLPITTHDSSLSKCIYSIAAAKLGESHLSFEYLMDVLKIDFDDTHHNTHHGLHVANLGGSYLALVQGLLGLTLEDDLLHIRPVLPDAISRVQITIVHQDNHIRFDAGKEDIRITSVRPISIGIYGQMHFVSKELTVNIINKKTKSNK